MPTRGDPVVLMKLFFWHTILTSPISSCSLLLSSYIIVRVVFVGQKIDNAPPCLNLVYRKYAQYMFVGIKFLKVCSSEMAEY